MNSTRLKQADAAPDQTDAGEEQQSEHDIAKVLAVQRVIDARTEPGAEQRAGEGDQCEPDHSCSRR